LVVAEAFTADDSAAQAAERLLGNMLHALQLHRHPRVALCSVEPMDARTADESDPTAAIARHVQAFAPSVVLVMGRGAVRAALARSDPLGKLRGAELAIADVPVVVTFGPHFLLRNPESKSAAWADLCRARALAGPASAAPMP
jgi:DNA polymerase